MSTASSTNRWVIRAVIRVASWVASWAVSCALLAAPAVQAGPEGLVELEGGVSMDQVGSHTEITTQSELSRAGFEGGFDIDRDESVWVDQPSAASKFFAEDWSGDPTSIDGSLGSNGIVGVINPYGIFIGDTAIVDVAGLVAAAGNIDEASIRSGAYHFPELTGHVDVAKGALIEADKSVLLLGRTVANYGHIRVPGGTVVMATGAGLTLARAGGGRMRVRADPMLKDPGDYALRQEGEIDAPRGYVSLTAGDGYSLAMNHSGITRARDIELDGGSGLVEVAGSLDASDLRRGKKGGSITVLGDRIAVDGELDASGDKGAGDIRVGGDVRGGGDLATSRRVYVGEDAVLRADALRKGDGGTVVVYADERTSFSGEVSAQGGSVRGDGGFAEISGRALEFAGRVKLGAENGSPGTLLFDPTDIEIAGMGVSVAEPGKKFEVLFGDEAPNGEPFVVSEATLEDDSIEGNIRLEAQNSIVTVGSFENDDVRFGDGVSVVMRTSNGPEDQGTSTRTPGIDLNGANDEHTSLEWITTSIKNDGDLDPASFELETGTGDNSVDAPIEFGVIRADGGTVTLTTELGSVTGGLIEAKGLFGFNGRKVDDSVTIEVDDGVVAITAIRALADEADLDDSGVAGPISIGVDQGPADTVVDIGTIETQGGALLSSTGTAEGVTISVSAGNIEVGTIDTDGLDGEDPSTDTPGTIDPGTGDKTFDRAPRRANVAGGVRVTTASGNVTIQQIQARGGDAAVVDVDSTDNYPLFANGSGAAGGSVTISAGGNGADSGHLTIGPGGIDTSGGTGSVAEIDVDGPEDDRNGADGLAGTGGIGGNVQIGTSAVDSGDGDVPGGISILGPIVASGGDSNAAPNAHTDADLFTRQQVALGGFGGTVLIDGGSSGADMTPENAVDVQADIVSRGGDATGSVTYPDPEDDTQTLDFGVAGGTGGSIFVAGNGPVDIGAAAARVDFDASGGDSEAGNGGPAQRLQESILIGRNSGTGLESGPITVHGTLEASGGEGDDGGGGGIVAVRTAVGTALVDLTDASLVADGGIATGDEPVVELPEDSGVFFFQEQGGNGGNVDVTVSGRVLMGEARARGGDSSGGLGGRGGTIDVVSAHSATASDDDPDPLPIAIVGSGLLDVSGGTSSGDPSPGNPPPGEADPDTGFVDGLHSIVGGGNGGVITVSATGAGVNLAGGIRAAAGLGEDAAVDDGEPGSMDIFAGGDVDAQDIGDIAFVRVSQFARDASTRLQTSMGGVLSIDAADPDAPELVQTVTAFDTPDDDVAALSYALRVGPDEDLGEDDAPRIDIEFAQGVGTVGSVSNSDEAHIISNSNGDIRGAAGLVPGQSHVAVSGTLQLEAENIGVDTGDRLVVDGAGGELQLIAGGSNDDLGGEIAIGVEDTSGGLAGIAVEQSEISATVDVEFLSGGAPTGEGILIRPEGDHVLVERLETEGHGAAFAYMLRDSRDPNGSQPEGDLELASGGRLGGDLLLDAQGAIRLAEGAIAANDNTVALVAAGSIGPTSGAVDAVTIDDPGALLALALQGRDSGQSTATLIVTSDDPVALNALTEGDLAVEVRAGPMSTGDVRITRVEPDIGLIPQVDPGVVSGGDMSIRTGSDSLILLGEPDAETTVIATSGGDQLWGAGEIRVDNTRTTLQNEAINDAVIAAGDDIVFEGSVDTATGALPARLEIDSSGTTSFAGDVGGDAPLAFFDVSDVDIATVGTRRFVVGEGVFGRIDGEGNVELETDASVLSNPDDESLTFAGNIGGRTQLAGFQADSRVVTFTGADSVSTGTGGIRINTLDAPDPSVVGVTIGDRSGDLTLASEGAVVLGVGHKLSTVGKLRLESDLGVTVGDLTANKITIESPVIGMRLRPPGPVDVDEGLDEDGNLMVSQVMDQGVDWVANQINTSAEIILLPSGGADGGPTLVLGTGGVKIPGSLDAFEVVRLNPGLDAVTSQRILASDGTTLLDLTADPDSPPVVGDPSREIQRAFPGVSPAVPTRSDGASPAALPTASASEVLAFVRCTAGRCAEGDEALLEAVHATDRGPLATERAREIARVYRERVVSREGRVRLRATFTVAARAYREQGARYLDGGEFYGFLAASDLYADARREIDDLAGLLVQVDLLGLSAEDTLVVQRTLAESFAQATALRGFDLGVALAAVDASPIGLID